MLEIFKDFMLVKQGKTAIQACEASSKVQLKEVFKFINNAIKKGRRCTTLYRFTRYNDEIESYIEKCGYKLSYSEKQGRTCCHEYTISWGETKSQEKD